MLLLFGFLLISSLSSCFSITEKEYAKLPPVFHLDDFDRCLLFEDEALYCYVEYHVKPIDPENPSSTWKTIQNLSADPKNYRHDQLRRGICIPLRYPNISRNYESPEFKTDLTERLNLEYEDFGIYGSIEDDYCQGNEAPSYDWFDWLAAVFIISYLSFVFLASCYEGLSRYKTTEEYSKITSTKGGRIISCFSIIKNWERLKIIEWTPDNVKLRSLQGVRFYNLFLVIAAHTGIVVLGGPVSNTLDVENISGKIIITFLASGPFGVSTFFFISALLVTYNIAKNFNKESKKELDIKTLLWILLYRYIRVTPSMAFVILFHSTLLYHLGQGPLSKLILEIDRKNCRNNGWANLLYINNWVNPSQMCMTESWYLAVDMQCFILILIFLYFTVKNPKRFWVCLVGAWILNSGVVVWHLYKKSVFHYLKPYPEKMYRIRGLYENDGILENTLYFTPMNLASTIIGTGVGFLIHRNEKWSVFQSKIGSFISWTLIYVVALAIISIFGRWIHSNEYYDSHWVSIPYLTLSTTIYSLAIAAGCLGLVSDSGWMTKWVLEWPPIYYLGRLSYASYLAHYTLTFYFVSNLRSLAHMSDFILLVETAKLFVMSLCLGLILALTVEFPISAISSLLIKRKMMTDGRNDENKNKVL